MTATHPSQPGYVPARFVAAGDNGAHKAGHWSPFEEEHVALIQAAAGVLGAAYRRSEQ